MCQLLREKLLEEVEMARELLPTLDLRRSLTER